MKLEQGPLAILPLFIFIFASPALAQARSSNEATWRQSIQSDIKNGAPASDICSNAMSSATTSDDANFKDWAYSVVRQYCPDQLNQGKNNSSQGLKSNSAASDTNSLGESCTIKQSQMFAASRGQRVIIRGSDCSIYIN